METEKLNKVTVSMLFLPYGTEPLLALGDQGRLSCGRWGRGLKPSSEEADKFLDEVVCANAFS